MATEYQLLSQNESNSNHSNENSTIIIPMTTGAIPRRSTSRQERRVPIRLKKCEGTIKKNIYLIDCIDKINHVFMKI